MTNVAPVIVQNHDGLLGVLEHPESLRVGSEARIAVRLTDGRIVLVPVDLMVQQHDGSFFLDLSAAEVARLETGEVGTRAAATGHHQKAQQVGSTRDDAAVVVPVFAESVEVEKRQVESGRVRIAKTVETTDQVVNDSLIHETVDVERVPINQVVEAAVGNRQEGETTVVPVYKEVLVVEKRLMLVEEVRITRRRSEQAFTQTVPVRSESVAVERDDLLNHGKTTGTPKRDH